MTPGVVVAALGVATFAVIAVLLWITWPAFHDEPCEEPAAMPAPTLIACEVEDAMEAAIFRNAGVLGASLAFIETQTCRQLYPREQWCAFCLRQPEPLPTDWWAGEHFQGEHNREMS